MYSWIPEIHKGSNQDIQVSAWLDEQTIPRRAAFIKSWKVSHSYNMHTSPVFTLKYITINFDIDMYNVMHVHAFTDILLKDG